jgi:hypothetical protein
VHSNAEPAPYNGLASALRSIFQQLLFDLEKLDPEKSENRTSASKIQTSAEEKGKGESPAFRGRGSAAGPLQRCAAGTVLNSVMAMPNCGAQGACCLADQLRDHTGQKRRYWLV